MTRPGPPIVIERLPNRDLLVGPPPEPKRDSIADGAARASGLVIHGYGGNKEEMLGLAAHVAYTTRTRLLLFDLPGHGPGGDDLLTLEASRAALDARARLLKQPGFVIGHSLGARLALMSGLPRAALISMPGAALFEGSRRELLRTLRARRVRESETYGGLKEIMAAPVEPAKNTLLLYAGGDILSSAALARDWGDRVDKTVKVPGCGHLDIVSHPATLSEICEWIRKER